MLKILYVILFLEYIMCFDLNKYGNINSTIGGYIIRYNNSIYNNYFYKCLLKGNEIQNSDDYNLEIKYNVTEYENFTKCNHNNKLSLCINYNSCYLKYNNGQYIYIKKYDSSAFNETCPKNIYDIKFINNNTCLMDIWKKEIKI